MTDNAEPPKSAPPPPPEDGIGERIKEKRTDLKLSVEQLADLTKEWDFHEGKGIPRSTLYGYEAGTYKPAARELRLLAYALNVSPTYLLLSEEWDAEAAKNAKIASLLSNLIEEVKGSFLDKTNAWRNHEHSEKLKKIR